MVEIIDGKVYVVCLCVKVIEVVIDLKSNYGMILGLVVVLVGEDFVS